MVHIVLEEMFWPVLSNFCHRPATDIWETHFPYSHFHWIKFSVSSVAVHEVFNYVVLNTFFLTIIGICKFRTLRNFYKYIEGNISHLTDKTAICSILLILLCIFIHIWSDHIYMHLNITYLCYIIIRNGCITVQWKIHPNSSILSPIINHWFFCFYYHKFCCDELTSEEN